MQEKLHDLCILIYRFGITLNSIFHSKARQWIKGRRGLFDAIKNRINRQDKIIWFHCASLGEFEQGRPVIENIKSQLNQYKVLLTFFSPSGYENQKNYAHADIVSYLPLDTKKNMKRFINLVRPRALVLVKYEFWPHMISTLHHKGIPIYVISAVFRENQIFFRSYWKEMRKILKKISHFFIQNTASETLLQSIGITCVTVCGDTRFDRVAEIKKEWLPLPLIEKFKNKTFTLIAGSTWKKDEDLLVNFINRCAHPVKFILAPHEIHSHHIENLQKRISKKTVCYSKCSESDIENSSVMIIDIIGVLTRIYGSEDIAYVGGGFGKAGIHNILEPAAFGMAILFGPIHHKFEEAQELIEAKGATVIKTPKELETILNQLICDSQLRARMGASASDYVQCKTGATDVITTALKKSLQNLPFFFK
ncbi:MAG: 3-deoxy-D-manno-octulosonic acid transferase [Flavobacteriales bacterium Tduv]